MNRERALEILELSGNVTKELLKKSFHKLLLQLHPDKKKTFVDDGDAKCKELILAYNYLKDQGLVTENNPEIFNWDDFLQPQHGDAVDLESNPTKLYWWASCYE